MQKNDIIQIVDQNHHWFPALLVVDEVKTWGVMAYAHMITNDNDPCKQAYIRLENHAFVKVGEAEVVKQEGD